MKWFIVATVALFAAEAPALAQVEGGIPGVYDLAQVTDWIASPDNAPDEAPTWYLASYSGAINNAGTNCNIQIDPVDSADGDIISAMLAIDSDVFLQGLRAEGASVSELGPITEFSADGNRGIRYLARSRYKSLALTHLSMQHVAGGNLVSTTCTATENVYGAHAPAIEWFIEDVRYVNPDAVNNLSRNDDQPPLIQAKNDAGAAAKRVAVATHRGIETSNAFRRRQRGE